MGYPVRSTTESGQPSTDDTALKHFGEPGRLLSSYVEAEKELGFNQSIRNVMDTGASRYHPSFRVPGTHTGRLSGSGGFNFQNLPKSLDYLKAFTVEEGYVIVTCDHASLEDYVLAELSRDASLWDFYAVGRKGNCMYLSVGSRLPVLGEKIREAGYDPDNWTIESVKAAKKTASKWRQIAKKIVLSANYGAGANKIHASLLDDGIDVALVDVQKMHKGFWELRKGVKVWEAELRRQWKDNGGWLLNGFGRPICLEPMREKDLVNSQGQSVGHDSHILFQVLTAEALTEAGLDWYPWHMDLHDCLMFAVKKDEAEMAVDLLKTTVYPKLNHMLGGDIHLKGEPNVCRSWADDKDEEFNWKENEEFQAWLGPQKRT
jgi:DNA polymerase I-like protein with 3'-5' exonuclease and polymerase domains